MAEDSPTGANNSQATGALQQFTWAAFGLMALIVLKESASEIPAGLFGIVGGVIGYFTAKSGK